MGIVIDEKIFRKARKRAKRREWIRAKTEEACEWVEVHKGTIIASAPFVAAVAGAIGNGIRVATKQHRVKKVQDLKNLYCYDRSLGHYWKLRRELTNDEWLKIAERKKNGERLADILQELKVLK